MAIATPGADIRDHVETHTGPHGLIERIATAVRQAQDDHARHEQLRAEHECAEAQALAGHKPEAERSDLPF